jgi:hypothetical protein
MSEITNLATNILEKAQKSDFYNGFADYLEFEAGGVIIEKIFAYTELQESDTVLQGITLKFKNETKIKIPVFLNTFFTKFTVTSYPSFKEYGYDDPVTIEPIKSSITQFALDLEKAIKNHPLFIK